ncbi:MAG: glycosyltransferase family 4 protein [Chloroflexi bacterium]|nr:glycosyltransferase family 4 protein [Chloroflexota bacterium]
MKIALVSPYDFAYPGGVMAHITHLGRELEQRGHTVKVLAPVSSRDAVNAPNLIPIGRPVPVPSGGSIARISLSIWRERRVRQVLREEGFDVIHLHEPLAPVLPITVLHYSTAANVGTFHAFHGKARMYRYSHRLVRRWFNKLHVRIAVSPPALQFVSRFFPAEYRVIPNGIDVDFFGREAPPGLPFDDGKLNILFVGRLEKRKGLKYLLGAFSRLKWSHPDLRLLVVGPGSPGKECERIVAERKLQDVVFVGGVSGETLCRYYQTAHIFCAPATGKESFGIVLGEAMAAGKPVVATTIEGFSAVVTNGVEGLLVRPRDEEALAGALEQLILDPDLRREMGQRGRVTVQAYRWDRVADRVEECYREAVALRAGRVPEPAGRV